MAEKKHRTTRQRKIILEELHRVDTHPTANEVYGMVRRRLPGISLGTVYRNLDMLSECGVIKKLVSTGVQRRFDGNMKEHYHVRCLNCGKIEDAALQPIKHLEKMFYEENNFSILGYRLEFVGLCPKCRRKEIRAGNRKKRLQKP